MTDTKTGKNKTTAPNSNADNNDCVEQAWSDNLGMGIERRLKNYESIDNSSDTDDDQVPNSEDTTTSFSLQECMDEFRARRRRKSSVSQVRQDTEDCRNRKTLIDTTDQDLINQNLCNKEQEKKCKPCRNGFCYCFTSDSGDGGGTFAGCVSSRVVSGRSQRRYKRAGFYQVHK